MWKQRNFCKILDNNNGGLIEFWLKRKQIFLEVPNSHESYFDYEKKEA